MKIKYKQVVDQKEIQVKIEGQKLIKDNFGEQN